MKGLGRKKEGVCPPPVDGRCERCGRHVRELKPFGRAGEPLIADFSGALLVKRFHDVRGCAGASWECRDCIVKEAFNVTPKVAVEILRKEGLVEGLDEVTDVHKFLRRCKALGIDYRKVLDEIKSNRCFGDILCFY